MTTTIVFNARELLLVAEKLAARSAEGPALLAERFAALGGAVEAIAIPAIRDVTPRRSGELADSTEGETEIDGLSLLTRIRQPAKSLPNQDGSGGGQLYVQWVIGGRGAIDAPSDGPFSTGKKALAGPGFGPVTHVGPALPNPYPDEAAGPITTAVSAMLELWGEAVCRALVAL